MVRELYSRKDWHTQRLLRRRYTAASAFVLFGTAALAACVCLLARRENALPLMAANVVFCTLGGWAALYWLFQILLPARSRERDIARLLPPARRQTVSGIVTEAGRPVTLTRYIKTCEITVEKEGASTVVYWDLAQPLPDFQGKPTVLYTVNHRVVAYEEAEA